MVDFENLEDVYFIGEIGINHNGDLQIAKKLIDAVNACNWSCAKFQKRNPDMCVPSHQKNIPRDTPWGTMKYIEYKHKIEFGKKEYDQIDEYCASKPIDWTASIWDLDSLAFLKNYEVPFIKIPSAMITDMELVSECAQTGSQIIMSTGMSTLKEVDSAVNVIMKNGKKPVVMHTNSSYPSPIEELNLSLIPFYKERYGCVIGYSGHEEDLQASMMAVLVGAKVIERHITLSHGMWGTDQGASLEVHAMDMLKKRCENIDVIMGKPIKTITPSEEHVRKKLRK